MCGFLFSLAKAGSEPLPPKKAIDLMVEDLKIRGPDQFGQMSHGSISLFHSRLSILDLEGGGQPMTTQSKDRAVVYNGEIFNFQDLKSVWQGEGYQNKSDTEVLLNFPDLESPESYLRQMKGMFAFSLVDFKKNVVLMARDTLGKKPLFIYNSGDFLVSSSRVSSIIHYLSLDPKNFNNLSLQYLSDLGFIPAPYSIHSDIEKFLPGEWRLYSLSGELLKRGRIHIDETSNLGLSGGQNFHESRFEEMMKMSINRRLLSDRKIGMLLSSGYDSSTISRIASSITQGKVECFTLSQKTRLDESTLAMDFASKFNLKCNLVSAESSASLLDKAIEAMDEPFLDLSYFPSYFVFKAMQNKITVAITGDGGDEVFGGYENQFDNFNFFDLKVSAPSSLQSFKVLKHMPGVLNRSVFLYKRISSSGFPEHYLKPYLSEKMHSIFDRIAQLKSMRPELVIDGDLVRGQYSNTFNIGLPDRMLVKVDAASMGAGIEARSPFLDEDLIAYMMSTDVNREAHSQKMAKLALKKYCSTFMEPRRKQGFSMDYWSLLPMHFRQMKRSGLYSDNVSGVFFQYIMDRWIKRFGTPNLNLNFFSE